MLKPEKLPPGFLERIDPEEYTIPELVALIIAERGSPMAIEEIADRMAELGVFRTIPSLRKSWHGLRELRKTRDGKLTIVPSREEWSRWEHLVREVCRELETTELPPRDAASKSGQKQPAPVDDTTPVTIDEVLTGIESDLPASVSMMRKLGTAAQKCAEITLDRCP